MIVRRQSTLVLWFNSALLCILVLILIPMQYTTDSNGNDDASAYIKLSNNCIMYDRTYDNRKALKQFPITVFGLLFLNPLAGAFICSSLIDLSKQRQKMKKIIYRCKMFLFHGGVVAGEASEAGEAVQREAKPVGMLLSLRNHFLFFVTVCVLDFACCLVSLLCSMLVLIFSI